MFTGTFPWYTIYSSSLKVLIIRNLKSYIFDIVIIKVLPIWCLLFFMSLFEKSPVTVLLAGQTKSRTWSSFKVNNSSVGQIEAGRMATVSSWVIGWGESLKIWIAWQTILVNISRGKRTRLCCNWFGQVMSGCPYFEKRHLYVQIVFTTKLELWRISNHIFFPFY